jgi:hypothetical protein
MAGEVSGGGAPNEKCTSSAASRQGTQGIVSVRSKVVGAAAGADQCEVAPAVDLSRLWRRGEEPSPRSLPGPGSPVPDQTVRNAWSGAGPSCAVLSRKASSSSGPRGQPRHVAQTRAGIQAERLPTAQPRWRRSHETGSPRGMYRRSIAVPLWPVCWAMTRSGTPAAAAEVARPARSE